MVGSSTNAGVTPLSTLLLLVFCYLRRRFTSSRTSATGTFHSLIAPLLSRRGLRTSVTVTPARTLTLTAILVRLPYNYIVNLILIVIQGTKKFYELHGMSLPPGQS